jgi:hypothetical protein
LRIPWSKEYIQIGRGHKSISRNDIVLPEKRVSNVHCRIVLGARDDEPDVWVEDRKSSNGTFVSRVCEHANSRSMAFGYKAVSSCNTAMSCHWDMQRRSMDTMCDGCIALSVDVASHCIPWYLTGTK